MSEHVGDLAARAASELRDQHLHDVTTGELFVDDERNVMKTEKRGIFSKVEFKWRDSDRLLLEQIRAAADRVAREAFGDLPAILDNFYMSLRVPELNDYDIPRVDAKGRIVFERDERGNYIEDWSRLTGQDLEEALWRIADLKRRGGIVVNDLLMEAMFAKRIATETYDDTYSAILDGTIGDKGAKARRESRQDEYHAFFRFWLYSTADAFYKELVNLQRVLERIRDRRLYGDSR